MIRSTVLLVLALGGARGLAAQDSTIAPRPTIVATLTLSEALSQARSNSPAYRQTLNNANTARWSVRGSYGALLPQLSVQSGVGYTGSGQSQFGAFFQQTSGFLSSSYGINLQLQLDGRALTAPGQQRALERATGEEISGAGVSLTADITTQYLTALQAAAQVAVARQQVVRNAEFLRLAQARFQVGQTTLIDVRQAEVTKSRSDVALLRAVQTDNEAKIELERRMGVEPKVDVEQLALTDSFPVTAPDYKVADLLAMASEQNPSLRALKARNLAAGSGVRAAKSEYLPRLFAQAGWSGFTQQYSNTQLLLDQQLGSAQGQLQSCQFNNQVRTGLNLGPATECNVTLGLDPTGTQLLDPVTQRIRDRNSVFPFHYSGQPFQASLTLSLPIFDGFGRSLRIAQARERQLDAEESVRASALQVRADVHGRFLALQTAYKSIGVQAASRESAREQQRLAQDRYRVGVGTSLELSDAQNAVQTAEGEYVNAVYDYHKALAALEAAVGRPLR